MEKDLKIVNLKGDYFDAGIQYGEQTYDLIYKYIKYTSLFYKKYGFPKKEVDRIKSRYINGIRFQHGTFFLEFIRGMSIGSRVDYDTLLNAILHMEIRAAALWGSNFLDRVDFNEEECTTYAATGLSTKDNTSIIGQNFDFSQEMQKFIIVSNVKPLKGNNFITVGVLGRPGSGGMNNKGLSIMMSGVRDKRGIDVLSKKDLIGIPPTWTHHLLKECNTVDETIKVLIRPPRSPKGENFILCDKKTIVHLEMAYDKYSINYYDINDSMVSSSNHFLSETMNDRGPKLDEYEGSYIRRERALNFMKLNHGALNVDSFKILSRDHYNHNAPICRHGLNDDFNLTNKINDQGYTVASMIALPQKSLFLICNGPPCLNKYKSFYLK